MRNLLKSFLLACSMMLFMSLSVYADSPIEISTPADLISIPNGSSKSYVLTCDLDMKGLNWTPKDFRGSLDGQGYTIFNLSTNGHSDETDLSYDGNMKVYDTYGAGLFGHLEGAEVKNLNLLGLKTTCYYTYDNSEGSKDPSGMFMGSIAGFMKDSVIENVHIEGEGYLETNAKCFGIGGFAGYGNGEIKDSSCSVTLTCIDTDKGVRDEQFMGGGYAAGCINLVNNQIDIQGFDSDHGYVHDGGLVGMYIHYYNEAPTGHIDQNVVTGMISFFEDNTDRRAYCEAYIGEIMCWDLTMDNNGQEFTRNETFDYSRNLLPHDCEKPHWTSVVTEPTETSYGYTDYHCETCGYEYRGDYTLWQAPEPEEETVEAAPETSDPLPKQKLIGGGVVAVLVVVFVIVAVNAVKRK